MKKVMSIVNDHIEEIFTSLRQKGIFDRTDIILTTDHGASYLTTHHGDQTDDNLIVPLLAMGPSFKKGYSIERNTIRNLDIPATVSRIFNFDKNSIWTSNPINEIFSNESEKDSEILKYLK